MHANRLRQRLEDGAACFNAWSVLASSHVAEILAESGYDSITIDLQHGAAGLEDLFPMLQAMRAGRSTPIIRAPWNDPAAIMKSLDFGAQGVICPMIDSAAQADEFVQNCRYPPEGRRSFGPTRAALSTGARNSAEYADGANANVLCFAMIETAGALDQLEDILSIPGLDGIYVGPADLSMSLGARPSMDPVDRIVIEAIAECLGAARSAGKFAAIHTDGPETARKRFEQGFGMCTLQSDARLLADGARRQLHACREAMSGPSPGAA